MKPRQQSAFRRSSSLLTAVSFAMSLSAAHVTALTWDGNGATTPNPDGGTGTWDVNTTVNWWDGAANVKWPVLGGTNDDAVFANTAGTISLATGGVTANDLTFNTTGYLIQSNTLTLNGTTPTITTATGVSATINSTISGAAGLVKSGDGTLILGAANNFSGGMTLNGGTLNPNNNAAFGSGTLTLSGGTLFPSTGGGAYTYANPVVVTADTTTTVFGYGGGTNPTFTGAITGSGTILLKNNGSLGGTGNTFINGDINGFTGTFSFDNSGNAVNFQFQGATAASRDGSQAHFVTSGGTTLGGPSLLMFFEGANTFKMGDLSGPGGHIRGVGAGMTFEIGALNTDTTYAGGIHQDAANAVNVAKVGSGTLTLSGTSSYTGATTINAGALELVKTTSLSTSGIVMGAANSPTLQLGSPLVTDSWTFAKPITGGSANAKIEKTGLGTAILTPGGSSSFTGSSTGALTVTGGKLYLNAAFTTAPAVSVAAGALFGGTSTAGNVTVANTGTLEGGMSGSGTLTAANVILGSGATDTATLKGTLATGGYKSLAVTNLTLNGGDNTVTLDAVGTGLANFTSYDLLVSTNVITAPNASGGLPVNVFKSNSRAYTPNVDVSGKKVQLYYDANATVYWTGAASSAWNPTATNWKLSGNTLATEFLANDVVFFHDSPVSSTVDISNGNVSPIATTFDNTTTTAYTLQGSNGIATGSLTKSGNGTLTITNANSTSGAVALNGGITSIASSGSLGSGDITFNGGTLAYTGATVAWTRNLTVNAGGGVLDITDAAANFTYTGTLSGVGGFTKTGAGTLTLPNASSYAGGITLSGGTLIPNNNTALGSGTLTLSGGTLFTGGNYTYANPVVVTAATTTTVFGYNASNPTFTGALTGSGTIYVKNDRGGLGNLMINGDISGFTGTFSFDNSGNGVNFQYQGTTPASRDGSQAHFVSSGGTTFSPGMWLFFAGAGNTFKMGELAGTAGHIRGVGANMTFEIGALNTNSTYGGVIYQDAANAVNVTKIGSGTLTLSGANDYAGTTTVSNGKLLVSNTTGSGTGSGAVIVTGGTLGGTGSIAGTVTLNGGTLAPGASIESLATGALTMNTGTTFAYEMNSTVGSYAADLLVVTGGVTLNGTVRLGLTDVLGESATPFAGGTILTLINYASGLSGGFFYGETPTLLHENDTFTAGLNTWKINYGAGTGGLNFTGVLNPGSHFINLTAIPEPGSWLALGCLVGSGMLLRSRRRH
jgi:autotransporter-associated beta strand protein